MAICAGDFST